MKTNIVWTTDSQGIQIPKALLDQSGIGGDVELVLRPGEIVIRAVSKAREGWEEAARWLGSEEIDEETREWLDAPLNSSEDEEWEWD